MLTAKTQMQQERKSEGRVIFRAYITTKDGRRIYPRRAKAFRICLG